MRRIIERLPKARTLAAIALLFLQTGCTLMLPYITANIVDKGILQGNITYIWQQGAIMLILTALSLVGAMLNTYIAAKIAFNFGQTLRTDIYRKVLSFSKQEYDQFGAASLITRNTNDVTQVQTLIELGLKFLIMAPLYLIGGITLTALLSPRLALVFVTAIPFLVIGTLILYKFANPLYARMQMLMDKLNLLFREGLTGVKVIRAFTKEEADFAKYKQVNQDYTRRAITAATIMSILLPFIIMLLSIATAVVLWQGAKGITNNTIEIGAVIAAISYGTQIMIGFGMLSMTILAIPRGQVSAQRIFAVLDTSLSITDPDPDTAIELSITAQPILAFDQVDFRYPGATKSVLHNISFSVNQGQTLAIIGSTGDGKSSLVSLINRLYEVAHGVIKIRGVDIRAIAQQTLHQRISFAPQSSILFMGTVRTNLLLAKPSASDEELWTALNLASATEFVDNLDDIVDKNGANFSGGQKQRLCIARTLLKDANIYIFDDSFSALDFKTDAKVRAAIKQKLQHAVTIIVAQRVATVKNADNILVLDNGNMVGLGKHDALQSTCQVYREIVESQTERRSLA